MFSYKKSLPDLEYFNPKYVNCAKRKLEIIEFVMFELKYWRFRKDFLQIIF